LGEEIFSDSTEIVGNRYSSASLYSLSASLAQAIFVCFIGVTRFQGKETIMGSCRDCLTRIPYATFIATVLCFIGIGVFCGTVYRGATLTNLILLDVFHVQVEWVGIVRLIMIILGGVMAVLALIMLVVGCLATGSTRHTVYRAWKARVGGRLSCAIVR